MVAWRLLLRPSPISLQSRQRKPQAGLVEVLGDVAWEDEAFELCLNVERQAGSIYEAWKIMEKVVVEDRVGNVLLRCKTGSHRAPRKVLLRWLRQLEEDEQEAHNRW